MRIPNLSIIHFPKMGTDVREMENGKDTHYFHFPLSIFH